MEEMVLGAWAKVRLTVAVRTRRKEATTTAMTT